MANKGDVLIVLHDVSSSSRIVDFAKVVQNYKEFVKLVVFSRVTGGASQYGLADASKILFKEDVPFLYVSDLKDVGELGLLKGYLVLQFSRAYGSPFVSLKDVLENSKGKTALVLSGSETGFSKSEIIEGARIVYPSNVKRDLSPEAYLAVFMHLLSNNLW